MVVSINILINYTNRILDFPADKFQEILLNNNSDYSIEHKGVKLFLIVNIKTGKVKPLPCISKVYTNNPDGKALKIANNNSKCYMSSKALGVTAQFNDCYSCHRQCIEEYNNNNIYLVKK